MVSKINFSVSYFDGDKIAIECIPIFIYNTYI